MGSWVPKSPFACRSRVRRPFPFPVFAALTGLSCLVLSASAATAQACGSGTGRYVVRVQPGLLAFPTPGPEDFAVGWIEHGPVELDVRPRGNANREWVLCLRAESADMGSGKPISDLQYRRDDQAGWTSIGVGDQVVAWGDRGDRVAVRFRILLDEATDPAGSYRSDYTVTATRQ
jgi:hypothetical protein